MARWRDLGKADDVGLVVNLEQVALVELGSHACVLTLPDGRRLRVHRDWELLVRDNEIPTKPCEWLAPGNDRSDD